MIDLAELPLVVVAPEGEVADADRLCPRRRKRVIDLVDLPIAARLFPVGRLDSESTGLILLTNDGELTNHLTHPSYEVSKRYHVSVQGRLTDQDATVRAVATGALGLHGTSEDVIKIVPMLEDESEIVRWEAAKSLQKLHNDTAIVPLSKRLRIENEPQADVRQACAAALGQYATVHAFESLVNALNDNDFGVVRAARDSLTTLTGQDMGSYSSKWVRWQEQNKNQLFGNRRQYTWMPFDKPRTFIDRMQFWKDKKKPTPRTPVGYGEADAGDAQSKS